MFVATRPDTTNEGWNSWPTEKVSHALVSSLPARACMRTHATELLAEAPADVVALRLAPIIRELVEDAVRQGRAERLRESLVAYALSRVDWLQLAQAEVEATVPEDETRCVTVVAA